MSRLSLFCASLAVLATLSAEPVSAQQLPQYVAVLTGDEEVPPVETEGFSVAFFSFQRLFGEERLVTVRFNFSGLSGPETAAHIHNGDLGVNGPVVVDFDNGSIVSAGFLNINVNDADDLTGPFTGQTMEALRSAMESQGTYINVHTAQHPGGEIRGQIQLNQDTTRAPAEKKDAPAEKSVPAEKKKAPARRG